MLKYPSLLTIRDSSRRIYKWVGKQCALLLLPHTLLRRMPKRRGLHRIMWSFPEGTILLRGTYLSLYNVRGPKNIYFFIDWALRSLEWTKLFWPEKRNQFLSEIWIGLNGLILCKTDDDWKYLSYHGRLPLTFDITSLKQMIVTAAQAIIKQTLMTKNKWRILSFKEHSGKRQWVIWNRS